VAGHSLGRGLAVVVAFLTLVGCSGAPRGAAAPSGPSGSAGSAEPGASAGFGAGPASASASAAGRCTFFPADNIWRRDVSKLPVHASSPAWVASIGATRNAHPDFGSGLIEGAPFGIPVTTVPSGQAGVKVTFQYSRESDPGPYPIPANALVEGGPNANGDRHVLLYQPDRCRLYELFAAYRNADGSWRAGSGAIFDLRSNRLRPAGWTSADAAGLPIMVGLVRYEEVAAGRIEHAIRLTAPRTRNSYLWPARHAASSSTDAALPPMGARFRLKASVDVSRFPTQARVVAEALKRYGAMLADNGSPWYLSGTQDQRWSNDALRALKSLRGSDFEAVDTSGLMISTDSAASR
jgi:hypothetical protein